MALSLRRWLLVVGGGSALIAAAALPVRPPRPAWGVSATASLERRAATAARERLAVATGRLAALRRADAVEARLAASPGPVTVAVLGGDDADADTDAEDALARSVDAELAALPRRSDATVGVFAVTPGGEDDGARAPLPPRHAEVMRGAVAGRPYCAMVWPVTARSRRGAPAPLGACAWVAAYGEPGPAIAAWLDEAAWGLAARRSGIDEALRDLERSKAFAANRSDRFGRRPLLGLHSMEVDACMAGDDAACTAAALAAPALATPGALGRSLRGTPVVHATFETGADHHFGPLGPFFMAELEAEHGPDAFARFWTSGRPVPEAFEAAFGEPLGAWVRRWTARRSGPLTAGPAPGGREVAGLLLWGALALAAAVAVVGRRRVG